MGRAIVVGVVLLGACGFDIRAADRVIDAPAVADATPDSSSDSSPDAPGPAITLAQVAARYENNGTLVSCEFANAQTAGNTNIVVVSWTSGANDVAGVTDTAGNTYVRAPVQVSGQYSLRLYYAENIVASATNRVSATFAQNMPFPKLRIVEYAGLRSANLYETGVGSAGTGNAQTAGPVTTTTPHTLLLATTVYNGSSMPVTPFEGIDFSDGDLIETREVQTAGTFTANASGNNGSAWVMMLVALRGR